MTAVEKLKAGAYGPEPGDCPISDFIPDNRRAYVVPHELRALFSLIIEARRELNKYPKSSPGYSYYRDKVPVESMAQKFDADMVQQSGVAGVAVEYHAHWLYSVLTHDDVVREHGEFEKRSGRKEGPPDP